MGFDWVRYHHPLGTYEHEPTGDTRLDKAIAAAARRPSLSLINFYFGIGLGD
jgi:hypothetical protein